MGHNDMIDNLLYVISKNLNLKFLTLDSELREFIRKKELEDILISPSEIK